MRARNVMPTTYLLLAILLMLALHRLIPVREIIPPPWHLLGLLLLALGIALNLMAGRAFHLARTPVMPLELPTALIRDGVVRVTRNPMYLGFVLMLSGVAVPLRSATPFGIVFPYGLLMDHLLITVEEANLERSFGEVWAQHRARVRRWL